MEALYHRKGGTELFYWRLVKVELTDVDELEKAVVADLLPHTTGFFFGESPASDSSPLLEGDAQRKGRRDASL
jgi:hypothetical protein